MCVYGSYRRRSLMTYGCFLWYITSTIWLQHSNPCFERLSPYGAEYSLRPALSFASAYSRKFWRDTYLAILNSTLQRHLLSQFILSKAFALLIPNFIIATTYSHNIHKKINNILFIIIGLSKFGANIRKFLVFSRFIHTFNYFYFLCKRRHFNNGVINRSSAIEA